MKKKLPIIILIGVFLVGLGILLYPTIANWWNSGVQSRAVGEYKRVVSDTNEKQLSDELKKAKEYNKKLLTISYPLINYEQAGDYNALLNVEGCNVIGYIQIPKIGLELPIYHGTGEPALNAGVGHLEGSSFPVGGKSTHAVLSGHRGLPSSELFTNLDRLDEGDVFIITVLNKTLTYKVNQIRTVLPDEVDDLQIVKGKDYVTLFTCTPYGVNTHRLLVRGERIPNEAGAVVTNEAFELDSAILAPIIGIPLLVILLAVIIIITIIRKKKKTDKGDDDTNE